MFESEIGEDVLPVLSLKALLPLRIILILDMNLIKPCIWISWNFSDSEYGLVPKNFLVPSTFMNGQFPWCHRENAGSFLMPAQCCQT